MRQFFNRESASDRKKPTTGGYISQTKERRDNQRFADEELDRYRNPEAYAYSDSESESEAELEGTKSPSPGSISPF
jgi:hypothetical protein